MSIVPNSTIGTTSDCRCREALPWLDLCEAERRLTEVSRSGDDLAEASARHAVDDARQRCAAIFGELLLYAVSTEGVRELLARLLNRLDPIDRLAREQLAEHERCLKEYRDRIQNLRHENWELARGVVSLEARIDALELEGIPHA